MGANNSPSRRSDKAFRKIFVDAGLTLVRREIQQGFPKGAGLSRAFLNPVLTPRTELFPVIAYALR